MKDLLNAKIDEPKTIDEIAKLVSEANNNEQKEYNHNLYITFFVIALGGISHVIWDKGWIDLISVIVFYLAIHHQFKSYFAISDKYKDIRKTFAVITPDEVDSLINKAHNPEIKSYIGKINAMDRLPVYLDMNNINKYLEDSDQSESFKDFKLITEAS